MTTPITIPGATPFTPTTSVKLPADATYAADVAEGAKGARARLVQEWLGLNGVNVAIDGSFGPATSTAVRLFQQRAGLTATGVVDRATFERLVTPMVAALQPIVPPPGATLGSLAVLYARQHLAQNPREIGGQNMGPWVRLYMDGNQGVAWPWCAGFATFVLRQAASTLGVKLPVTRTFSCDVLAGSASSPASFSAGCPDYKAITPGSLFFVKRTKNDWEHVGLVTATEPQAFHTIEGNTNDSGDREGYEVCERVRSYDKKDFIII
jgi:Putative peptidoglycan binding domain